jgi:hypothetical protein
MFITVCICVCCVYVFCGLVVYLCVCVLECLCVVLCLCEYDTVHTHVGMGQKYLTVFSLKEVMQGNAQFINRYAHIFLNQVRTVTISF